MGYVSPEWGPVSLSADHFGGYSEASSVNLAVNLAATDWLSIQAGPYFGLDRREEYRSDGAFANVGVAWDFKPSSRQPQREQ